MGSASTKAWSEAEKARSGQAATPRLWGRGAGVTALSFFLVFFFSFVGFFESKLLCIALPVLAL